MNVVKHSITRTHHWISTPRALNFLWISTQIRLNDNSTSTAEVSASPAWSGPSSSPPNSPQPQFLMHFMTIPVYLRSPSWAFCSAHVSVSAICLRFRRKKVHVARSLQCSMRNHRVAFFFQLETRLYRDCCLFFTTHDCEAQSEVNFKAELILLCFRLQFQLFSAFTVAVLSAFALSRADIKSRKKNTSRALFSLYLNGRFTTGSMQPGNLALTKNGVSVWSCFFCFFLLTFQAAEAEN